jgi:hypothetical protein
MHAPILRNWEDMDHCRMVRRWQIAIDSIDISDPDNPVGRRTNLMKMTRPPN